MIDNEALFYFKIMCNSIQYKLIINKYILMYIHHKQYLFLSTERAIVYFNNRLKIPQIYRLF